MLRVVAALVLLACATPGAAAADKAKPDPEIGRCVKRVRGDERTCIKAATDRCREGFETDLVGCFGSHADCPKACIAEQAKCRSQPQVDQEGCKLACGGDQKVDMQQCRVEPDQKKCQVAAKVKALKCKQKCAADAAPTLQACMGRFDDCLTACNKATTASTP
ncbi:MAG TPA: hypothetical protein VMS22_25710 [Candidatus Eisenbacteria bacterium]|nr:hypothetical protein [Candidatus Eisenbacteria bacterium]